MFNYKILLACFVIALFIGIPAATAATVTKDTVTAYGWNSCGGWYKTGGTFANYCPFCKHSGTLAYNPKGTYEGEWTCKRCDADFCNCGRCKAGGSGVYLKKATATPEKKSPSPNTGSNTTDGTKSNPDTKIGIGHIFNAIEQDWSLFK